MQKHDCLKDEAHHLKLVFTQRPETRMKTLYGEATYLYEAQLTLDAA